MPPIGSSTSGSQMSSGLAMSQSLGGIAEARFRRLPVARYEVRAEERDRQRHDDEQDGAVDVLPMVEEVPIDEPVRDDHDRRDRQPDSPVGAEVLPHCMSNCPVPGSIAPAP